MKHEIHAEVKSVEAAATMDACEGKPFTLHKRAVLYLVVADGQTFRAAVPRDGHEPRAGDVVKLTIEWETRS